MEFGLSLFQSPALLQKAVNGVLKQNDTSRQYGLELSEKQARALVENRGKILRDTGRIETDSSVMEKLIYTFCDSPYVSVGNYEDMLNALLELFYIFKNETNDKLSDDELLSFMKKSFDGDCFGSLELLAGRDFSELRRRLFKTDKSEAEKNETQANDGEEDA